MKRRKTALLLALALSVTAVFTACGGSSQSSSSQADPAEQTKATAPSEADAEAQEADAEAQEADAADQTQDQTQAEAVATDLPQATDQAPAVNQAQATAPAEADAEAQEAEAADQTQPEADAADQEAGAQSQGSQPAASVQPAGPVADQFHVELQEISRVTGKGNYRVTYDSLVGFEGDSPRFCTFDGNFADDRTLTNMDYLGWGLYSVTVEIEGEVNSTGLVDAEGEVLIPFDVAIIEFPKEHPVDARPRYILTFTGTEQTTNQDEALFFVTSRQFAIVANEDDVFFKGNLRVFDLETRQYVSGLEYTQGRDTDFAQVGDNILVDVGDKAVLYSPDGQPVYTEQNSLYYNHKYFSDRPEMTTTIMDANGNKLYSTEAITSMVGYRSDYIQVYKDSKYSVIDAQGNPALPGTYDTIYGEDKGRFRIKNNGDSDYTLIASDGSTVMSGPNMFEGDTLGFVTCGDTGNYTLATPANRVITGLEDDSEELVFTKDDETSYLVLNTGEFASANGSEIDALSKGVIALESEDGKTTLIDAFTGQELMSLDHDGVDDINDDYIYCEDGDDLVIYKVVIVPES